MSVDSIIASGRRLIATSLLDRGTIQRRTLTSDSTGGATAAWEAIAAAVACRFGSVIDPDPTKVLGVIEGPRTAVVLMGLGQDVKRGDRIVNDSSGSVWLVVGFKTADSNTAVAQRILVTEVLSGDVGD